MTRSSRIHSPILDHHMAGKMWRFIGSDTCRLVNTKICHVGAFRAGDRNLPKTQPKLVNPSTIIASRYSNRYWELYPLERSVLSIRIDYSSPDNALDKAGSNSARCIVLCYPRGRFEVPAFLHSSRNIVVPDAGELLIGSAYEAGMKPMHDRVGKVGGRDSPIKAWVFMGSPTQIQPPSGSLVTCTEVGTKSPEVR